MGGMGKMIAHEGEDNVGDRLGFVDSRGTVSRWSSVAGCDWIRLAGNSTND